MIHYYIRIAIFCVIAALPTHIVAKVVSNGEFVFQVDPSVKAVTLNSIAVNDFKTSYTYNLPVMHFEFTTPSLNFDLIEGYLCFPTMSTFPPGIQFTLTAFPVETLHDLGGTTDGVQKRLELNAPSGFGPYAKLGGKSVPLEPLEIVYMGSNLESLEKRQDTLPFRFDILGMSESEIAIAIEYNGDVTVWKRSIDFDNPETSYRKSGAMIDQLDSWDKVASCHFGVTDNITLLTQNEQFVIIGATKIAYMQPIPGNNKRQKPEPKNIYDIVHGAFFLDQFKADGETSCTIRPLHQGRYTAIIDKASNKTALVFDDGTYLAIDAGAVATTVSSRLRKITKAAEMLSESRTKTHD